MHEMQTIVTVSVRRSVSLSVCHDAQLGFTVQKQLNGSGSMNIVSDGDPDPTHSEVRRVEGIVASCCI